MDQTNNGTLQERIAVLEEFNARADRLQAKIDIQNLMGRYVLNHRGTKYARCLAAFASETDEVSAEIEGIGAFRGRESLARYYLELCPRMDGNRVDVMHDHFLGTPLVEVAPDGKTAAALWISEGQETYPLEGKPRGAWVWGKYAVDFTRQADGWRILHLRFFKTFTADFHKSWAEEEATWLEALRRERFSGVKAEPFDAAGPELPAAEPTEAIAAEDVPASALNRAQAYFEVQNLMSRFLYLMADKRPTDAAALFSAREDASAEFADSGLFLGRDSITRLLSGPMLCDRRDGAYREQNITTPHIQVAGDGRTAKGLWLSDGHETIPLTDGKKGGVWLFNRFAAEFVLEDGIWRIWKMQMFHVSVSEYATPFTEGAPDWFYRGKVQSDAPTTFHQEYDKHGRMVYWPQLPQPYETWADSIPMTGSWPEGISVK